MEKLGKTTKFGIKPSVVRKFERKKANAEAVERNYQKGNTFPSADFKNEIQAELSDVLMNKGRHITPAHDVSEDVLKLNASKIKSSWTTGKRLNLSYNSETNEYINTQKDNLTIAAYRVKINRSSDISNTQITVTHDALVLADPTKTSTKSSVFEFEDDETEIEAMVTPWITDDNGIRVPVVLMEMNSVGRNAFIVSGMLTGMSVSIESMSVQDILLL